MAEVTLPRHGRTTGEMSIMDAQRRSRAGLTSEREQAAGSLAALKAERASVAAKGLLLRGEGVTELRPRTVKDRTATERKRVAGLASATTVTIPVVTL
jgi:hypothetical protein